MEKIQNTHICCSLDPEPLADTAGTRTAPDFRDRYMQENNHNAVKTTGQQG